MVPPPPGSTLFPYTTLFRSQTVFVALGERAAVAGEDDDHRLGVLIVGEAVLLVVDRSEEHTSELQSQSNLVCRLLLEKKNITTVRRSTSATSSTVTT